MCSRTLGWENVSLLPPNFAAMNLRLGHQRLIQGQTSNRKYTMSSVFWRAYSMPVSLEESSSQQSENYPSENDFAIENSPEELLAQPLSSDEVPTLLLHSFFCCRVRKHMFDLLLSFILKQINFCLLYMLLFICFLCLFVCG